MRTVMITKHHFFSWWKYMVHNIHDYFFLLLAILDRPFFVGLAFAGFVILAITCIILVILET